MYLYFFLLILYYFFAMYTLYIYFKNKIVCGSAMMYLNTYIVSPSLFPFIDKLINISNDTHNIYNIYVYILYYTQCAQCTLYSVQCVLYPILNQDLVSSINRPLFYHFLLLDATQSSCYLQHRDVCI